MKMRHKETGFICEGERHGAYYILSAFVGPSIETKKDSPVSVKYAVLANDYEPLPTEQWRDCTEELEIDQWGGLHRNGEVIFGESKVGYRLRKVQLLRDNDSLMHPAQRYDYVWAFLVEHKEDA